MTVVAYNGVNLPYPTHTSFQQNQISDDVSGTDKAYTEISLTCQCIVNTVYKDVISNDATIKQAGDVVSLMKAMRVLLLTKRKKLSVQANGVELIPASGAPDGRDAANGPEPQSCVCTLLTDVSFLVSFSITAKYCEPSAGTLIWNRWSETQDIDNCNFSTRTRSGTYAIRSDGNGIVDSFRPQMAVLGVPKGFLRQSSQYTVDPGGLKLAYTVVDKEYFKPPPPPAYEADGYYDEETTKGGGKRYGNVHVRLKGSKNTLQTDLVKAAVIVCRNKLLLAGGPPPPGAGIKAGILGYSIMESTHVRCQLYENMVEVTMRALMHARSAERNGKTRFKDVASINFNALTYTPLSENKTEYRPGPPGDQGGWLPRGSASLLLQAASYWDPALKNPKLDKENQIREGKEVGLKG